MILLDSNIIIAMRDKLYTRQVASQLEQQRPYTCNVVIAEVLGFSGLTEADSQDFIELFSTMTNLNFDDKITQQTIEIRKLIKINLPDAIIAATAIANGLTLWTHNIEDFENIPRLKLFDPLA